MNKLEVVKEKFHGKLVGKKWMQNLVAETLTFFPTSTINFVTENVWFMSSFDDAWGFTFKGDDLQGKYLIFLSDELLAEGKSQAFYTIAHEIGHVILNHRNAVLEPQSKGETSKQEEEADSFARKYLSKTF